MADPDTRPAIVRFVENWTRAAGRAQPEPGQLVIDPATMPNHHRPAPLSDTDRARLDRAARRALQTYPGVVGEFLHREIRAYLDFGYRFDGQGPVLRLADAVSDSDPRADGPDRPTDEPPIGLRRQESAMTDERMDSTTKLRLRTAAAEARQRYPGPVGELISQELRSWMVFGHLLGSALILRVADDLTATGHDGVGER